MSTAEERMSHGGLGNERLKPMALLGDEAAVAILLDRGNVLTDEGRLRKERTSLFRDRFGIEHELYEVVVDGRMVQRAVDGVAITGNIIPFA